MKQISLTQGKFALVDDKDYDFLMQWKWQYHRIPNRKTGYAVRSVYVGKTTDGKQKIKQERMHRIILKISDDIEPDHIDGNGLNNQRYNLRPATNSQNQANRHKRENTSSIFKGVRWHPASKKWMAQISMNSRTKYLGIFISEEEAARVYNAAAKKHFGDFAKLNEGVYL